MGGGEECEVRSVEKGERRLQSSKEPTTHAYVPGETRARSATFALISARKYVLL